MNEINKINPFINTPTSQPKQNPQTQDNTGIDLSKLQDGVSKFSIGGGTVTLFKRGDSIDIQAVGIKDFNREEILAKIMEQINSKK